MRPLYPRELRPEQARLEGYFRIEWKLAAQRTHAMAEAKPFLLPVVIDATRNAEAHLPPEFKSMPCMRLAADEASATSWDDGQNKNRPLTALRE